MAERFALPVAIDNDANAAAIAEWQVGAGRGHSQHGHAHARDGRRRRARPRRQAVPRLVGRRRDRPHGARVRRRAVRRQLHRPRPPRGRSRRARRPIARPRGPRAGRDRRASSSARPRGNDAALEAIAEIGRRLGAGDRLARQHLRSGGRRPRRRVRRGAGDLFLEPAPRGRARRRRLPPGTRPRPHRAGRARRRTPAWSGPGSSGSRRSTRLVPLAVCATPIGNLEDVTLRVLRELARGGPRPLRGHAADADPARAARDRGAARSATTSTTRPSGRRRCCRGSRPASGSRSSSDAGLPGVSDPGRAADRGGARGGRAGDGAAGPVGGRDGARRERARRRALPVRRLPAAGETGARRALGASSRAGRMPGVAFESPQRLAARASRSLADALPERPVAVCRELTKRFEEVVRGTAGGGGGEVRRAAEGGDHARARRRRRRSSGDEEEALAAVAELVEAGCPAPAGGRRRRAAHRRVPEPPLPRLAVARFDNGSIRSGTVVARGCQTRQQSASVLAAAALARLALSAGASAGLAGRRHGAAAVLAGDDPYAGGQHRGIDIGAPAGAGRARSAARGRHLRRAGSARRGSA